MTPESTIFLEIINNALKIMLRTKKINEKDLQEMNEEIKDELRRSSLPMSIENKIFLLFVFSNKPITSLKGDPIMGLNVFKFSFDVFYQKCFEFIGPVEADKVISMSIQKASEKDEAFDFDPKYFLS